MDCTSLRNTEPAFPLEQCVQVVSAACHTGGIALAENAVDELVAAHNGPDQQMGALRALELELISRLRSATGEYFIFANNMIELLDARMRILRVAQKQHGVAALGINPAQAKRHNHLIPTQSRS
jgi:hypothetical protein